jgi:hypothetical protein
VHKNNHLAEEIYKINHNNSEYMKALSTAIASGILGLLAIAPITLPSNAFANEMQPDGPQTINVMGTKHTALSNSLGSYFQGHTDSIYCFQEQLQGQSLADMTVAKWKFESNISKYLFSKDTPESLTGYQPVDTELVFSKSSGVFPNFKGCQVVLGDS